MQSYNTLREGESPANRLGIYIWNTPSYSPLTFLKFLAWILSCEFFFLASNFYDLVGFLHCLCRASQCACLV